MEFGHFLEVQNGVYDDVRRELQAGRKESHWMWFVFPQLKGLGRSPVSQQFALDSVAVAERYLAHELLGARLRECTRLVLAVKNRTAEEIFGYPDWMKFRSSMTLFSLCQSREPLFEEALDKFFAGEPDAQTLTLLSQT